MMTSNGGVTCSGDQISNLSPIDIVKAHFNNIRAHLDFLVLCKNRYYNFLSVLYKLVRRKYPIQVDLKKGGKKEFSQYIEMYYDLHDIRFDIDKDSVDVDGVKFVGGKDNGDIVHVFINQEYSVLPVRGRVVLDVGANIADSSIYFVLRGAKMVYAIEPDKGSFELAKQNIKINNMDDRVSVIWSACSARTKNGPDVSSSPLFSLSDLLKKYSIPPDIMKMDCEGCEYETILNSPDELLRRFNHIQIEYHQGYKNIKEKLERCGFHVEVTGPTYCKDTDIFRSKTNVLFSENHNVKVRKAYKGWIVAKKIDDDAPLTSEQPGYPTPTRLRAGLR